MLGKLGFIARLYTANRSGETVYLIVYVDDILVGSKSEKIIAGFYEHLRRRFEIANFGHVKFFLGLEIRKEDGVYSFGLSNYINKLVNIVGLVETKTSKTPMEEGFLKDTADTKLLEDNTKYRSVVGAILYIAVCARPDIMATATVLGRKVSAPTEKDWTAAKRAVRYLKDTKDWKLKMGGEHGVTDCGDLIAFSDADWAGDSS